MIVKQSFGAGLLWWWQWSQFILYFWETIGKMWEPFWSLKATWKTLGPAQVLHTSDFDRNCKFALVSIRSAGPN